VPALTSRGCYPVEIRFDAGPRHPLPTAVLEVAVSDEPLAQVFDRKGVSRDNVRAEADFDRTGASYSAEALYKAHLAPGAVVSQDGLDFTWPHNCALDHVLADGQTVVLPAAPPGGRLGFLGAAEGAPEGARGAGIIIYTDGSTESFELALGDWTLGGGKARAAPGNQVVAALPYHNRRRDRVEEKSYVFYTAVHLQPGKIAKSITLPAAGETKPGRLHIFALAVGG
jgi:hypothetical protein